MVKYQMTRWGLFNSCIRDHKTNSYYSVITETYIVPDHSFFIGKGVTLEKEISFQGNVKEVFEVS